ncbi:MAG: hypothetical protein ABSD59_03835 [Terracidiphilus sp.]|jgi:hypothetical protein
MPPEADNNLSQILARKTCLLSGVLMALSIAGCTASTTPSTSATSQPGPQTYFAPYVAGTTYSSTSASGSLTQQSVAAPQIYTIDDGAATLFSQTIYNPQGSVGPQVLNAGTLMVGQRGLRSLTIQATYIYNSGGNGVTPGYYPKPPKSATGSFAVELAGQAGGLVQLFGQPVVPLVAAAQCPNFTTQQTYQFVTIPNSGWNPITDTAYGSVNISSSGSTVTLQNPVAGQRAMDQHTVGGTAPTQPSASPVSGACGPTTLGDVTGVPGQYVVNDPGISINQPPQAAIGIGATGLLVEDNGSTAGGTLANTSPALTYENVLGAGTGAVGLPQPSGDITTSVVGARYLGFVYAAGFQPAGIGTPVVWSSNLASFGFPSTISPNCPYVPASTTPPVVIYGGDYANYLQQNEGYGICDFAIDLGAKTANGLYTNAWVYVGTGFPTNTTVTTVCSRVTSYSNCFPAVAIAGELPNGSNNYALFVLGYDGAQPWAIYLLQSSN